MSTANNSTSYSKKDVYHAELLENLYNKIVQFAQIAEPEIQSIVFSEIANAQIAEPEGQSIGFAAINNSSNNITDTVIQFAQIVEPEGQSIGFADVTDSQTIEPEKQLIGFADIVTNFSNNIIDNVIQFAQIVEPEGQSIGFADIINYLLENLYDKVVQFAQIVEPEGQSIVFVDIANEENKQTIESAKLLAYEIMSYIRKISDKYTIREIKQFLFEKFLSDRNEIRDLYISILEKPRTETTDLIDSHLKEFKKVNIDPVILQEEINFLVIFDRIFSENIFIDNKISLWLSKPFSDVVSEFQDSRFNTTNKRREETTQFFDEVQDKTVSKFLTENIFSFEEKYLSTIKYSIDYYQVEDSRFNTINKHKDEKVYFFDEVQDKTVSKFLTETVLPLEDNYLSTIKYSIDYYQVEDSISNFLGKISQDFQNFSDNYRSSFNKIPFESILFRETETKQIQKNKKDELEVVEQRVNSTNKNLIEYSFVFDFNTNSFEKINREKISIEDSIDKQTQKRLKEYIYYQDSAFLSKNKPIQDFIYSADNITNFIFEKRLVDEILILEEVIGKTLGKGVFDQIPSIDYFQYLIFGKRVNEYPVFVEEFSVGVAKTLEETHHIQSIFNKQGVKYRADEIPFTSEKLLSYNKVILEEPLIVEIFSKLLQRAILDSINTVDDFTLNATKRAEDIVSNEDYGWTFFHNYSINGDYFAEDYVGERYDFI